MIHMRLPVPPHLSEEVVVLLTQRVSRSRKSGRHTRIHGW